MAVPKNIKSLSRIARAIPAPDELRAVVDGLIGDRNARAAAISSAALLDGILEGAIISNLTLHSEEHKRAMFGAAAPLGGFAAKVDLGCALKLYGPRCRSDLRAIGEIRNAFAHATVRLSFKTPEVAAVTRRISLIDRFLGVTADENGMTPRNRYMQAVRLFSLAMAKPQQLRSPLLGQFARAIAE